MADHYVVLRWPLDADSYKYTEVFDDVDEAWRNIADLGDEDGEFRVWRLVAVDDSGGG
jgi:hypothetical protein